MKLSDITADSVPNWQWTANMHQRFQELKAQRAKAPQKEDSRRRQREDDNRQQLHQDDGFLMGVATGIPIPLTPQSVMGAAIHNSMPIASSQSESYTLHSSDYSSSSSYDSGSSSSSFD